jgi:hypothetical protein
MPDDNDKLQSAFTTPNLLPDCDQPGFILLQDAKSRLCSPEFQMMMIDFGTFLGTRRLCRHVIDQGAYPVFS